MLNIAVWFVAGAAIGTVAAFLMRDGDDQGVFANVLVGVLAALVTGFFLAPRLGLAAGDPRVLDLRSLSIALVGAIVALAGADLLRRKWR